MSESVRVRTINDLARLAGVSAGTVSRALADSHLIAQATRDRIQALAREHRFRPNLMARNLRTRRTGAIGVLIPQVQGTTRSIADPFFVTMLGHLVDGLAGRGYDLLLTKVITSDPDWLVNVVDSGRVDGVFIIGQSQQSAVIDAVASRYLPVVAWGARADGQLHCTVETDDRAGGELAARHLIERGARRIAFVGDPARLEVAHRRDGARAALAAQGLGDLSAVVPVPWNAQAGRPAISAWLDQCGALPDGIIAASDAIAQWVLRALAEKGLAVPGDVRVIGHDDLPFSDFSEPPLTTVRQDLAVSSARMVDLMFRRIAGEAAPSEMIDPVLVVRGSA